MIAPARFAVYLAPPPASALWRFGCAALGRDALTGERCDGFAVDGLDAEAWRERTAEPRRYGFHATLKAPFRLADGASEAGLDEAIAAIARDLAPFDAGPLAVSKIALGDQRAFVALTPASPSPEIARLEERVVRALDPFRAPLTASERKRRNPARLTARQRDMLETWGYPFALAEFRPHFTLTGAASDAGRLAAALTKAFARRVADPRLVVDALVLFIERADGEFRIERRYPFGG